MANSKTLLNAYCKERHLQLPVYSTERGKETAGYDCSVLVSGRRYYAQAVHLSEQLAEEDAARVAYNTLRQASNLKSASGRTSINSELKSRSAGYSEAGYGYEEVPPSSASSKFAKAKSLATQPANPNAYIYVDYSQKLEKLCNARGLPAPEYDVMEPSDGKFVATVVIGDDEYSSGDSELDSESRAQAKNYASLIALAEVGLRLLDINEREDGTEDNLERNELYSRHEHQSPSPTAAPNKVTDVQLPERNYKAMVNEYCQKNDLPLPEYVTEFPDDSTGFVSVLTMCDKEYRSKPMAAKKKAEQNVAGKAALDIGLVTINERDYASGPKSTVNSSYTSSGGVGPECVSRFSSLASSSSRLTSLGSSWLGGHTGPLSSYSSLTKGGASVPENITANYKGMLQEFLAKRGLRNPQYSTGAGYGGRFVCTVTLTDPSSDEDVEFEGRGYANKKSAEQSAAKQAYTCLTQGI